MFLAKYKWYRTLRGGTWYFVSPNSLSPYTNPYWTRRVLGNEKILKQESTK